MATETKENLKLLKELQELVKTGKKPDEKALKSIGIDPTLKSQEFRNIKITNDFWNGLNVSVIDHKKDLDGNQIAENKKLILRIKNLYENENKKIKITDLTDLNIWTSSKAIEIGNFRLINNSDILVSFDYTGGP